MAPIYLIRVAIIRTDHNYTLGSYLAIKSIQSRKLLQRNSTEQEKGEHSHIAYSNGHRITNTNPNFSDRFHNNKRMLSL